MNSQVYAGIARLAIGLAALSLLAGCTPPEQGNAPGTGGIAVQAYWGQGQASRASMLQAATRLGAPPSVITIRATVEAFDLNPSITKDFVAADGSGTIDNIPTGSNRTLTLKGYDSGGFVLYEKTTTGIPITEGVNTPLTVVLDPKSLPPSDALDFTATAGNGDVLLDLTLPTNTVGALIRRATDTYPASYTDGTQVYFGDGTALPITDSGLSNGALYYYTAFVYDSAGIYSAGVNANAAPSVVGVPQNVVATAGDASVSLIWDPVTGVDFYNVYRSTTSPIILALATKNPDGGSPIPVGTESKTDTTVSNGTAYYYAVTALLSDGTESGPSDEVSGVPSDPPPTAAPTNVITTPGDEEIVLVWDAVADATSYNVYRASTSGGYGGVTPDNVQTTSFTSTGLVNGSTYYYVVYGVNGGGEGPASAEVSDTPSVTGVPDGVSASGGNTQVDLSWNAVTGATAYTVYWATSTGVSTASNAIALGNVQTHTHTGLSNGTTYYYVVTATLGTEGSISNEVSATSLAPPPSNFVGASGNGIASLSWDAITNADSYIVYWSTTQGTGTAGTAIPISSGTTYSHTGLSNGTPYYYVVTTLSGTGESGASAEVAVTPNPPLPTAPTGVSAALGNGQVTVTWAAVGGAASYNIYWGTSAGVNTATGTLIAGATSGYVHTGLSNGTTYYYIVTAVNVVGEGPPSSEVSATPAAPPAVPANFTGTAGDTEVSLQWSASTGANSYTVYWSNTQGMGTGGTAIAGLTGTTYTHTGLTNGDTYYYVVTATGPGGESAASSEVIGGPQVPVPGAPVGVSAAPGNAEIAISWSAVTGATSYNVYGSTTSGTGTGGTPFIGVTSPYTVSGLFNGTTYYSVVTAVNAGGESPPSSEVSGTPVAPAAVPTGVTAVPANNQVTISWNDATGAVSYNLYWSTTQGQGMAGTQIIGVTSPYIHTGRANGVTYYYVVTGVDVSTVEGLPSDEVSAVFTCKWGAMNWGTGSWQPASNCP